MDNKQLWNVHYKFYEAMGFGEGSIISRCYLVVAGSEEEALAKGNKVFAGISTDHAGLVGGEKEVNGRVILRDLEKKVGIYEGLNLIPPQLDGLDAVNFELETKVQFDDQNIKVAYLPRPKTG